MFVVRGVIGEGSSCNVTLRLCLVASFWRSGTHYTHEIYIRPPHSLAVLVERTERIILYSVMRGLRGHTDCMPPPC